MTNHDNGPLGGNDPNAPNGSSSHADSMFRGVAAGIAAALIVIIAVTVGA